MIYVHAVIVESLHWPLSEYPLGHYVVSSFFVCSTTPAQEVLQAINRFLILNPDIHLMPSPSLTHLTALYAVSHHITLMLHIHMDVIAIHVGISA